LRAALDLITTRQFTRIDLGLAEARRELASDRRKDENPAVIVLLTDGKSNPEPVGSAVHEAELAKADGAITFTIGLGAAGDLDDDALRLIASRPADHYRTPDADELAAIYERIAGAIPCPAEGFWGRR
jgi:hypothetical protein